MKKLDREHLIELSKQLANKVNERRGTTEILKYEDLLESKLAEIIEQGMLKILFDKPHPIDQDTTELLKIDPHRLVKLLNIPTFQEILTSNDVAMQRNTFFMYGLMGIIEQQEKRIQQLEEIVKSVGAISF